MSNADPSPSPKLEPITQAPTTDEEDIQLAQDTPMSTATNEDDDSEAPTEAQRFPEYTYENTPSILMPKRQPKTLRMRAPPTIETGAESPTKRQKQKAPSSTSSLPNPAPLAAKSRTPTPRHIGGCSNSKCKKKACTSPTHLRNVQDRRRERQPITCQSVKGKPLEPISPKWVERLHYILYPTTTYHPRAYGFFPELTQDGLPRLDAYRQGHNPLCHGCGSYRQSVLLMAELLHKLTERTQEIGEKCRLLSTRCEQLEKHVQHQTGQAFVLNERQVYWQQRAEAEFQQRVAMERQYRRLAGELSATRKSLSECLSGSFSTMSNEWKERWLMGIEDKDILGPHYFRPVLPDPYKKTTVP